MTDIEALLKEADEIDAPEIENEEDPEHDQAERKAWQSRELVPQLAAAVRDLQKDVSDLYRKTLEPEERHDELRHDLEKAEAEVARLTSERDGLAKAISSDMRRWPVYFGSPYADAKAYMQALSPSESEEPT